MYKLLIFGAVWCNYCNRLKEDMNIYPLPVIPNVSTEYVDVDENEELTNKYNIGELPAVILVKGDTEINRTTGVCTTEQVEDFIIENLSND